MKIQGSEISVVIQGPVTAPAQTRAWVAGLRELLPGCEILLSNQMAADQDGCGADAVITSQDPGGVPHREGWVPNNVNRQIVSTQAGLAAASRPYAVKLRSDQTLTHTGFLERFACHPRPSNCLFERPVLASTIYSINPRRWMPLPFHPGDMFHFGLREDLLALWGVPLAPEPETTRWFESRPLPEGLPLPWSFMRFAPEQWLWLSFLRMHQEVECRDAFDIARGNLELSESSLARNLILAAPASLGLHLGDRHPYAVFLPGCYTEGEWRSLHARHVQGRWRPALDTESLRQKWISGRVRWKAGALRLWGAVRLRAGALRRQLTATLPHAGLLS
jgi:hypothetical protein